MFGSDVHGLLAANDPTKCLKAESDAPTVTSLDSLNIHILLKNATPGFVSVNPLTLGMNNGMAPDSILDPSATEYVGNTHIPIGLSSLENSINSRKGVPGAQNKRRLLTAGD